MDLADLHEMVPAAQEEDLLEEVEHERWQAESADRLAAVWPDDDPSTGEAPTVGPDSAADPVQEPPLRPGQVLGLVEHVLGAQVIAVRSSPR